MSPDMESTTHQDHWPRRPRTTQWIVWLSGNDKHYHIFVWITRPPSCALQNTTTYSSESRARHLVPYRTLPHIRRRSESWHRDTSTTGRLRPVRTDIVSILAPHVTPTHTPRHPIPPPTTPSNHSLPPSLLIHPTRTTQSPDPHSPDPTPPTSYPLPPPNHHPLPHPHRHTS